MLPRVWEYCEKHKAAGRTWRAFYPYKLLELWWILQTYKPQSIVEYGSGCTTAVFAEYAVSSGADLTTVDESHEWQGQVLSELDAEHRGRVEFITAPTEWIGASAVSYKNSGPRLSCDFIYVDGPANRKSDHEAICLDAQPAFFGSNLKTAVFDIRRRTVEYCKHFNPPFNWQLSAWHEAGVPWYLSGFRHHTVARRRA